MLRDEFKSSKDSAKKAQLASKINDVQERIDELTEKISKIIKLNATKDIPKYGQQAVAEVKAILSNGNITVKQLATSVKLSECPCEYKFAGYPAGYHTREIIEKLGLDYDELKEKEVFK